jgi:hypothetical protein
MCSFLKISKFTVDMCTLNKSVIYNMYEGRTIELRPSIRLDYHVSIVLVASIFFCPLKLFFVAPEREYFLQIRLP